MADLRGKELGGYRLVEQVAMGGMAVIYKAYDPKLERVVALKILPEYLRQDPEFAARFQAEARNVARLRHPNILPIYGYGDEQGLSYFVMELVEGGTLKDLMTTPMAAPTAVALLTQVAAALQYAHDEGIIHRDVKPRNVLMLRPDWAVLSDFGIARVLEGSAHLTQTGRPFVGTPHYMAPEQARGERVQPTADQYALGIVLYEMLTGGTPFHADTPQAIAYQHVYAELPLPRERNPAISDRMQGVILRALSKHPDDRFPDVSAFAAAAQRAIEERDVGLERSGPPLSAASSAQATTGGDRGRSEGDNRAEVARRPDNQASGTPMVPIVTATALPTAQGPVRRSPLSRWLVTAMIGVAAVVAAIVGVVVFHANGASKALPVAVTIQAPGSSRLPSFRILGADKSTIKAVTPTGSQIHVNLVPGQYTLTLSDAPTYSEPAIISIGNVRKQVVQLGSLYGLLTVLPAAGRAVVPDFDLQDTHHAGVAHSITGSAATGGIYVRPGRYDLSFYASEYAVQPVVTVRAHQKATVDLSHTLGFLTIVPLSHAPASGFSVVDANTGKTVSDIDATNGRHGVFLPPGHYHLSFYYSNVYVDAVSVTVRPGSRARIDLNTLFATVRTPAVAKDYSVSYAWREGSATRRLDAMTVPHEFYIRAGIYRLEVASQNSTRVLILRAAPGTVHRLPAQ